MARVLNLFQHNIKHWYIPLIIGLLFIAMAIYTFFQPIETYYTLSFIFSLSFLFSGITGTYFAIANREELEGWGWYLVSGVLSLILGIYLLSNPLTTAAILPFAIGFYVLMQSTQGLIIAFDLKRYGVLEWGTLAIISILGFVFGALLMFNPRFGGMTLVMLTGIGFFFMGVLSIMLSLSLKKLKKRFEKMSPEVKDRFNRFKQEYNDEIDKLKD